MVEVSAVAVAPAPAFASFSCDTGAPAPGSPTLTLDWLLPTSCWPAVAAALAACATEASWSAPLSGAEVSLAGVASSGSAPPSTVAGAASWTFPGAAWCTLPGAAPVSLFAAWLEPATSTAVATAG